jgi:hypothetical protein
MIPQSGGLDIATPKIPFDLSPRSERSVRVEHISAGTASRRTALSDPGEPEIPRKGLLWASPREAPPLYRWARDHRHCPEVLKSSHAHPLKQSQVVVVAIVVPSRERSLQFQLNQRPGQFLGRQAPDHHRRRGRKVERGRSGGGRRRSRGGCRSRRKGAGAPDLVKQCGCVKCEYCIYTSENASGGEPEMHSTLCNVKGSPMWHIVRKPPSRHPPKLKFLQAA